MPLGFISKDGSQSAAAASVTITRPANVVAGDLLIAHIFIEDTSDRVNAVPTGWEEIVNSTVGTRAVRQYAYWKIAGASEPASYQWGINATDEIVGQMAAFDGADPVSPIGNVATSTTDASGNCTAPSIDVQAAGNFVLHLCGNAYGTTYTPPSGFSEIDDRRSGTGSGNISAQMSFQRAAATGATGDVTANSSADDYFVASLIEIKKKAEVTYADDFNRASIGDDWEPLNYGDPLAIDANRVTGSSATSAARWVGVELGPDSSFEVEYVSGSEFFEFGVRDKKGVEGKAFWDFFNRSNGALGTPPWVTANVAINSNGVVLLDTGENGVGQYVDAAIGPDQFSAILATAAGSITVASARGSSDGFLTDGYILQVDTTASLTGAKDWELYRINGGAPTLLASGTTTASPATPQASIVAMGFNPVVLYLAWGNVFIKRVEDSSASRLTSGYPGFAIGAGSGKVDDWMGGDVAGADQRHWALFDGGNCSFGQSLDKDGQIHIWTMFAPDAAYTPAAGDRLRLQTREDVIRFFINDICWGHAVNDIIDPEIDDSAAGFLAILGTSTFLDNVVITAPQAAGYTLAADLLDAKIRIKSSASALLDGKATVESASYDSGALDGKIKIFVVDTKIFDGKLIIGDSVSATLDGRLVVGSAAVSLLDGSLSVVDSATDQVDGKITIKDSAVLLMDGSVVVSAGLADLLDGVVVVQDSATLSLDGKLLIPYSASDALDGKVRIGSDDLITLDGRIKLSGSSIVLIDGKIYLVGPGESVSLLDGKLGINFFGFQSAMMMKP